MSITGITAPQGFSAAAATAGIKPSGKSDMALVVNQGPLYTATAVFTKNRVCASPVKYSREVIKNGSLKAVIYNSGNANACNGPQGDKDCASVVEAVAKNLGVEATEVAACSTGIIGETLPVEKMLKVVPTLVSSQGDYGYNAATAIMTTDTVHKEAVFQGKGYTIGAMGKGVGMMAPSLATMLVCITTDAIIDQAVAQEALKNATAHTFDRLDIDGTTSTNDTVILMASGASGVEADPEEFTRGILSICHSLAQQMQADGEGVTKRVTITVEGTTTDEMALNAARTVGRDNLFKCAMFGSDPNWGRVLAAVGMAQADMDPDAISVYFNDQAVCINSTGTPEARSVDLSGIDIDVRIDLGTGGAGKATVYTTDLSHQYVEINSAYTT